MVLIATGWVMSVGPASAPFLAWALPLMCISHRCLIIAGASKGEEQGERDGSHLGSAAGTAVKEGRESPGDSAKQVVQVGVR